MNETASTQANRKERVGIVVSDVQAKTIVVQVERQFAHPLYGKVMTRRKRFHAHDEENTARIGDTVRIVETRPLSKLKRWRLVDVIRRGEQD